MAFPVRDRYGPLGPFRGISYHPKTFEKLGIPVYLAGALGLQDTGSLWDIYFLNETEATRLFRDYNSNWAAQFHAQNAQVTRTVYTSVIEEAMYDSGLQAVWKGPDMPSLSSPNVTPYNLYAVATLWYAAKLVNSDPVLFSTSSESGQLDTYDLVHAWKLLALVNDWDTRGALWRYRPSSRPIEPIFYKQPTTGPFANKQNLRIQSIA